MTGPVRNVPAVQTLSGHAQIYHKSTGSHATQLAVSTLSPALTGACCRHRLPEYATEGPQSMRSCYAVSKSALQVLPVLRVRAGESSCKELLVLRAGAGDVYTCSSRLGVDCVRPISQASSTAVGPSPGSQCYFCKAMTVHQQQVLLDSSCTGTSRGDTCTYQVSVSLALLTAPPNSCITSDP